MMAQNATAIHSDLREIMQSKWSKVEKAMNKVIRRSASSHGVIARRTKLEDKAPSPPQRPSAPSSHHHHHTIISVDLENLNSHHTNVQNVHSAPKHAQDIIAGYGNKADSDSVKMIKASPNKSHIAHRHKRRVRSASLDPSKMEQSGKRNAIFRSRPSSHAERK